MPTLIWLSVSLIKELYGDLGWTMVSYIEWRCFLSQILQKKEVPLIPQLQGGGAVVTLSPLPPS